MIIVYATIIEFFEIFQVLSSVFVKCSVGSDYDLGTIAPWQHSSAQHSPTHYQYVRCLLIEVFYGTIKDAIIAGSTHGDVVACADFYAPSVLCVLEELLREGIAANAYDLAHAII
jgi:hypothetical protein